VSGVQDFSARLAKKGKILKKGQGTDEIIEEVDEFYYVGNVMDCKTGLERAVRARVVAAFKQK